jgi:hypothetical protein
MSYRRRASGLYAPVAPVARRPLPRLQPALGPWDPPRDPTGEETHHDQPPELVWPPTPDIDCWLGDFGGVTLANDPRTVPLVSGCNTTPANMMISFLFPEYDRTWQDIILTEHCWRGYSHFHLDRYWWESAGLGPTQAVQLLQYIQSWGFFTSYWGIGTSDGRGFDSWAAVQSLFMPTINALTAAGSATCEKTILIVGEELDTVCSPVGLADIAQNLGPILNDAGIAWWIHLTTNYDAWQGGAQDPTQQAFWQMLAGVGCRGLCWQGNPGENFTGVGAIGAHMYDARRLLASASGALKVCAFEPGCETNELYGRLTEQRAKTIAWQICCCPQGDSNIPAVAGTMAGIAHPDGSPILPWAA